MRKAKRLTKPVPSNDDGIPPDELILADIVQRAAAHGLGVCWGPSYTPEYDCCCAAGAAWLNSGPLHQGGRSGRVLPGRYVPYLVEGSRIVGALIAGHEGGDALFDPSELGYQAGVAFADAMPRGKRVRNAW